METNILVVIVTKVQLFQYCYLLVLFVRITESLKRFDQMGVNLFSNR